MLFSSDNKKSQIVPVLPAASREAGRMVTSSDPAQKKSGMISAVRPAVGGSVSGTRPAISGMRAAISPSMAGAPTQIMPAVEMPGTKRDGRSVAIWVLSALLLLNMAATTLLLVNMDRPNPQLVDYKVQLDITQEELAAMKTKLSKLSIDSERRMTTLQMETDGVRGHLHLLQDQTATIQRTVETSPHDPGPSTPPSTFTKEASK